VDEGYTSGILVQEDATFPWLEMVPGGAEERVVPAEDVDTMAISRFMYSIVWRGSICRELSPSLGPKYEARSATTCAGTPACRKIRMPS